MANATTLDVEPQLTAENVLQQCELSFKSGHTKTLCFPWFSDFSPCIYDDIRRLWERERSHSVLKLRITSTATFPVIIELMPSGSHEKAAAGLAALIISVFERTTQRYYEDFFVPLGATRVSINSTEKAADASFAPAHSDFQEPSVVIEVGRSETIMQLRGDMSRWFSLESVNLVILLEISKPSSESVHPNLSAEMWFRTQEESFTQIAVDWTTGIPGPLQIPLCTLLGSTDSEGLPEELCLPVERLERLRDCVISAWTEEASLFDFSELLY